MNPAYSSLLCTISNHGALEKSRAESIYNKIKDGYHKRDPNKSLAALDEVIDIINQNIAECDQKIVETDYGLPGAEGTYLVFTSTTDSGINKLQTCWKPAEAELFRIMLREIVTCDELCLSLIRCLNFVSEISVQVITRTKAEAVIRKWINLGYFFELDENIFLGPRLIAEFSTSLRTEYKEFVPICDICKAPMFWGSRCGNCEEMFHKTCFEKYLSRTKACPSCKKTVNSPV